MAFGLSVNFNGNCREAVAFYAEVFGLGEPHFITYQEMDTSFDSNFQVSEQMKNRGMAQLMIEGSLIEFSDMPDAFGFIRGNSFYLTLMYEKAADAAGIFEKLSSGGKAEVAFAKIPGQGYYGMLTDPFGLGWIIKAEE